MVSIHGRGASPPSRGAPKTGTWYEHTRPAATRTARSDALARYAPGPSVTRSTRRADDPADVRPCKKRFQRLAVAHVRGWERGRAPAHGGTRGSRAHAHVTRSHTAHISHLCHCCPPAAGRRPAFKSTRAHYDLRSSQPGYIEGYRKGPRRVNGSTRARSSRTATHLSAAVPYATGLLPLCTYHEQMYRGCSLLRGRGAARGR